MATIQVNEKLLDEKLMALEAARSWSPRVISKLESMIRSADDYAVFRINPVQYAAEKNMNENEAIDLFLYATKAGLFEMDWHLICAFCAHVVESLRSMDNLHAHFRCGVCESDNDADLDDYIQVTFTISPQVRSIAFHDPESLSVEDLHLKYHFSKGILLPPGMPTFAELAQMITKFLTYLEPHEKKVVELDLAAGRFTAKDVIHKTVMNFFVHEREGGEAEILPIHLINGKFHTPDRTLEPMELQSGPATFRFEQVGELASGKVTVEVTNLMDKRSSLWLVHYPPGFEAFYMRFEPFLSGKKLLTTQTFRDLFRSEVVSRTEGIGVKDITFLFTDLKGSTAMYDQIGDPKAYYLVRQHFDTLSRAIAQNSGAIVKTIGDAVMATFMNPVDAVKAAIEMLQGIEEFNRGISNKLSLKIGIHRGHSIVVTLNDRLDYFGQTVNIAARVQGLADADEIYISQDAYSYPSVDDALAGCNVSPEQVVVKGVSETLHVHKITV
jgi:class 3 adenylate cyclase